MIKKTPKSKEEDTDRSGLGWPQRKDKDAPVTYDINTALHQARQEKKTKKPMDTQSR